MKQRVEAKYTRSLFDLSPGHLNDDTDVEDDVDDEEDTQIERKVKKK